MKMQAKDLKVGMTVTEGSWYINIHQVEFSAQKNGTPTVIVNGMGSKGKKDKYGRIAKPYLQERMYKHLTFVNAN